MLKIVSNVNLSGVQPLDMDTVWCGYDPTNIQFTDMAGEIAWFHLDYSLLDISDMENLKSYWYNYFSILNTYIEHHKSVLFIISNASLNPYDVNTFIKKTENVRWLEGEINNTLSRLAITHNNVLILDFNRLVRKIGYDHMYARKFWYLGRMAYTADGHGSIRSEIAFLYKAYMGNTKKVLVLDLDNTLWGGIIGEDGIGGIHLSNEGLGKAYYDFQLCIKELKKLGILLAINSKNNEKDVIEVFNNHPQMVLTWDDFVIKKINWHDKATNMRQISEELGLDLKSFVFIDDNPAEREFVLEELPENTVAVPTFPEPEMLKDWFLHLVYVHFPKINLTQEDKTKADDYKKYLERNVTKTQSKSVEEFIASLDIKLVIYHNSKDIVPRLSQLTQKTNQFNMSGRRYSEHEIYRMMDSKVVHVFGLKYEDKFGNEGIIGEAVVFQYKNEYVFDTFLLSCRVIGRNVEHTFIDAILEYLKPKNRDTFEEDFTAYKESSISFLYADTGKNELVKKFLDGLEFTSVVKEGNSITYQDKVCNIWDRVEKQACAEFRYV